MMENPFYPPEPIGTKELEVLVRERTAEIILDHSKQIPLPTVGRITYPKLAYESSAYWISKMVFSWWSIENNNTGNPFYR